MAIRKPTTYISFDTYHRQDVVAELIRDGRYPRNANFFHDIPERELKNYPYSLDKIYEVQVAMLPTYSKKPISEDVIRSREGDPIKDLRIYMVNDILVADYIALGSGNLLDQRMIRFRDTARQREFTITINLDQSRKKVTKQNFDGLLEMVGSFQFKD